MQSPFTDTDNAFEVFYDERVVITHGGMRTTLDVCIFTDMTGDALDDNAMDTDRQDILVVFKVVDWPYMSNLVRGDMIERTEANGVKYRIQETKYDAVMGWVVRARSC